MPFMGKDPIQLALEDLRAIFGEDFGTAQVLAAPSEDDKADAYSIAQNVNLSRVVQGAAMASAQLMADELERLGLRAADYVDLPKISEKLRDRLVNVLQHGDAAEYFMRVFYAHLGLRG